MELEHEIAIKGPTQAPSNLWLDALRHLLEKRSAVVGLIMLGALTIIAILAPVLATHDPIEILRDAKRNYPAVHPSAGLSRGPAPALSLASTATAGIFSAGCCMARGSHCRSVL